MNGLRLAREMGFGPTGLHYIDESDGRSSVVAGYTTGGASLLVQSETLYRPAGSSIWLVKVDPRETGDGPSYMIDAHVAGRYRPLTVPPVPGHAERLTEHRSRALAFNRTMGDLNQADLAYWQQAAISDFREEAGLAPGRLAAFYGDLAGGAVKVAFSAGGAAFGALYAALPRWVQIGIPVGIAGVATAGAVSVIRTIRAR